MAAVNVASWNGGQALFMGSPGRTNGSPRREPSRGEAARLRADAEETHAARSSIPRSQSFSQPPTSQPSPSQPFNSQAPTSPPPTRQQQEAWAAARQVPSDREAGTPVAGSAMPGLMVFGIHIEEIPATPRPPPSPIRLTRPTQGGSPNLGPTTGGVSPIGGATGGFRPTGGPIGGPTTGGVTPPGGLTGGPSPVLGGRSRSANKIPRLSAEEPMTQSIFQEHPGTGGEQGRAQGAWQQGKVAQGGVGARHGAGQAGGRSPKPAIPRSSTGDFVPRRARDQPKDGVNGKEGASRDGSPSRRPGAPKLPPAPGLQKTLHKASPGHPSHKAQHKSNSPGHPKKSSPGGASLPVVPVRHASPVNPKFSPAPFLIPEEPEEAQPPASPAHRPVLTPTPPPSSPGPNGDSALSANAAASANSTQQKRSTTPIKAEYSPAPFGDETQWEETTVPELRPRSRPRTKKRPTAKSPTVFNVTACSSQQAKGSAGRSVLKATTPLSVPSSPGARFSSPVRGGPPMRSKSTKDDVSTGWTTSVSPSACTSPARSPMSSVHSTPVCLPGRTPSCQMRATASAEAAVGTVTSQGGRGEAEQRRDPVSTRPIRKVVSTGTSVSLHADVVTRASVGSEAAFTSQSNGAFTCRSDAEMDLKALKKTGSLQHARVVSHDATPTVFKPTDPDWPTPSTPRKSGGFMSFFGKLVRKDSTSGSVPQSPRLGPSGSVPQSTRLGYSEARTQSQPTREATATPSARVATTRLERSSSWQARTGRGSEAPTVGTQPGLPREGEGLADNNRGFGFARSSSSNFMQSGKSGGGIGESKVGFPESLDRAREFTTLECKLTQSTSGESISILNEVSSTSDTSSSESSESERCSRSSHKCSSAQGQARRPTDFPEKKCMVPSAGSPQLDTSKHGPHYIDKNAGWEMQLPPEFVGEFQLKQPISGRRNRMRSMSSCSAHRKADDSTDWP